MILACAHSAGMMLTIGRKAMRLPQGYCDAERIKGAVDRHNPPFSVHPQYGQHFSVRKKVFLSVDGLLVECENEDELYFACKLVALDHNRWQTHDDENLHQIMDETARMEAEAKTRMEAPLGEEDILPGEIVTEEEDISIDEWSQRGYKWFQKEDVVYL
jgi:hypothetical protein